MMCDCLKTIDENLKDAGSNTQISRIYTLGTGVNMFPAISTELIEKKRGSKPMSVLPTYCPWCGLNYKTSQPAPTKAAEVPNG